jgi:hypothetical protein
LRVLTVALGFIGGNASGATIRQIPEQAKVIDARLAAALKPTVREWIAQEAMKVHQDTKSGEAAVRADIQKRFSGQSLSSADIEALVFLVLMETSKSAQEDLKAQMAEMQAANKNKAAQRQPVTKIKSAEAGSKAAAQTSLPPKGTAVQPRPDASGAQKEAQASGAAPSDKPDSLSELGETESLRLQLAMDRHAKMIETLSNLMKKAANTDSAIIGNLK